jgi:hypothetical protein
LTLHKAVQQFEAWLAGLDQGDQAEGFITAVPTAASKAKQQQQQQQQHGGEGVGEKEKGAGAGEKVGLVYQEYNPLRLQGGKGAGGEVLTFTCFDDALDEYYGKVRNREGQGLRSRWKEGCCIGRVAWMQGCWLGGQSRGLHCLDSATVQR